jgi:hypothetical protein
MNMFWDSNVNCNNASTMRVYGKSANIPTLDESGKVFFKRFQVSLGGKK